MSDDSEDIPMLDYFVIEESDDTIFHNYRLFNQAVADVPRQAIEILTKNKNISFKDIHIIGKMLQN